MFSSLRIRLLLTMSVVVLVAVGTIAVLTSRTTTNEFQRYVASDVQHSQQIISNFLTSYPTNPSAENLSTLVKQLSQASGERFIVLNSKGLVQADSDGKLVGQTVQWPGPYRYRRPDAPGEVTRPVTDSAGVEFPGPAPFTGTGGLVQTYIAPGVPYTTATSLTGTVGLLGGGPGGEEAGSVPGFHFIPFAVIPAPAVVAAEGSGAVSAAPGTQDSLIVVHLPNKVGNANESGFLNSVNQQLLFGVAAAGIAALLLTWLLSRRILGPVEALTRAAGRMEKGDLSQRVAVKSKDEIGKLAHAFNSMSDGLSTLEQARRNMVTDVAHELRTPVSNIRGYLEAMMDGVVKPDSAIIQSLHEEAILLSRLVEDLQELELAEAGKLKLLCQNVDPGEIIEKAVTAMQAKAVEKSVNLQADLPTGLPTLEADPERLGQIMRNLLNNAITHTPAGGHVDVTASCHSRKLEVRVSDTGPGIAQEHLPHIFDRFYRADQSRARSTGGAGLGLAIVKELVEMHGGHVRAESTLGHGATFYVTLPVGGVTA